MTKREIKVIKCAKTISNYCDECDNCTGCIFRTDDLSCTLDTSLPVGWELPVTKTYKQDFLEKFPNAHFETYEICRKMVYGEIHDCCGKTCQECWDEVFIEK